MSAQQQQYLAALSASEPSLLRQLQRGIEKESLRVCEKGCLSQTPHPTSLGSALTHPSITTDFSEALLELITPVETDIEQSLQQLEDIHRFVYSQLDNESLWVSSMPCVLQEGENIPLARYGSSNVAQMKTAYRRGLGNRYGRAMQTIAGIHYNFSLPENLWPVLQRVDNNQQALQDYITERYFALIRNFQRFSWLLLYLFGSSPAVCKSFIGNQSHQLEELREGTLYLPYATALRMGDLGYQSKAQQNLKICYNTLDNYLQTLRNAIVQPHPDYETIGLKNSGKYQQLSTALLQIENEFYSPIRPKRVARSGETALNALHKGGVEYIEVRCVDVNPFLPLGIDAQQIRFMDCFLLHCLLKESPLCDDDDRQRIANNLGKVVNEGRRPGLTLCRQEGEISLSHWGNELLSGIEEIAELLDQTHGGDAYRTAYQNQRAKLDNPTLTPSAQILAELENGQSFYAFAMKQSDIHQRYFCDNPLPAEQQQTFARQSEQSLQRQAEVEAADTLSFDDYLHNYFQQYQTL